MVLSIKVSVGKKDLIISLATKMLKNYTFMYVAPKNEYI